MTSLSNITLKRFAAVLLFSTGLGLIPCNAQSGSLIKDIRFPSEVTAGEPVHIEIQVADQYLGTAIFRFGSEQQGPYRLVRCSDQASGKIAEGSISEQVGRRIVIDVDPGEGTICWLRVNGTKGCELHMLQSDGANKKAWVNASKNKGTWRWVRVEALERAADTTKISFLVPPVSDCILDCVAFSKDPDFNPEGILSDANKFTWQTNSSSAGTHTFTVSVKANGKIDSRNIVINVLPEKKNGNENKTGANSASSIEYIDISEAATLPLNPPDDNLKILADSCLAKGSIVFGEFNFPLSRGKLGLIAVMQPKPAQDESGSKPTPGESTLGVEPQAQDMQRSNANVLPESVDIPIKSRFGFLHFLHGVRGSAMPLKGDIFAYTVKYEDGTTASIPVREDERVAGQLRDYSDLPLASRVCSSYFTGVSINLYLSSWENPFPQKMIQSIQVTSKTSDYLSYVVGIAGSGTGSAMGLPHDANEATEIKATINANVTLGKVNRDLFSMNDPYLFTHLFKGKFASRTPYLSFLSEMGPRHVRLWNPKMWEGHPNADDIANLATAKDLLPEEREGLDWIKKEGKIRILYVLCKALPEKEPGEEANWPAVTDWYAAYVDYLVNEQKYPIDYINVFNEQILGKAEDVRNRHYRFYNLLAPKIKKVCPSVKIGGTAECWPDVKMLEELVVHCGTNMDFLSWHYYAVGTRVPFEQILPRCGSFAKHGREVAEMLKRHSPDRKIESLLTEYNMRYGRPWKPPVDERLTQGYLSIWLSSVLMQCQLAGNIDGAYFWHFAGGSVYGSVSADSSSIGDIVARPSATLFEILNNRLGNAEIVSSVVEGKSVECYALQTPSHLVLIVINTSNSTKKVRADILNARISEKPGSFHRPVEIYEIAAKDPDFTVTKVQAPVSQKLDISMRPFSQQLVFLPGKPD